MSNLDFGQDNTITSSNIAAHNQVSGDMNIIHITYHEHPQPRDRVGVYMLQLQDSLKDEGVYQQGTHIPFNQLEYAAFLERNTIVIGAKGYGKTYSLNRFLAYLVDQYFSSKQKVLPIRIQAQDLSSTLATANDPPTAIKAMLIEHVKKIDAQTDDLVATAIDSGTRIILVIDDIDDIPTRSHDDHTLRADTMNALLAFTKTYQMRVVLSGQTVPTELQGSAWNMVSIPAIDVESSKELFARAFPFSSWEKVYSLAMVHLPTGFKTPWHILKLATMLNDKVDMGESIDQNIHEIYQVFTEFHVLLRSKRNINKTSLESILASQTIKSVSDILDAIIKFNRDEVFNTSNRSHLGTEIALYKYFREGEHSNQPIRIIRETIDFLIHTDILSDDGSAVNYNNTTTQYLNSLILCAGIHFVTNVIQSIHEGDRIVSMMAIGLRAYTDLNLLEGITGRLNKAISSGKKKDKTQRYSDILICIDILHYCNWNRLRQHNYRNPQKPSEIDMDTLQIELTDSLLTVLGDKAYMWPIKKRIAYSILLGHELKDTRYPVLPDTPADDRETWVSEIARAMSQRSDGYFCPLRSSASDELFIGRYVITNEQWRYWVEISGGTPSLFDAGGLAEDDPYLVLCAAVDNGAILHPNQPVVGIAWTTAIEFCRWLTESIQASTRDHPLLHGKMIELRLPTEEEWELAAATLERNTYPWGDAWSDDHAPCAETQQARQWDHPVPIGCYPAGAAACGAHDMVGNVWQWTSDPWIDPELDVPEGAEHPIDEYRIIRGGSFLDSRDLIRCTARDRELVDTKTNNIGFRIVCHIRDMAPTVWEKEQ